MSEPVPEAGYGAMLALIGLIAASVWLGTLAQRAVERGNFLKGFFLGNRGLGSWALALTATVQSGGTFMGFPSLVYTFGWIVALWIASYMVVPITGFAILGKRLAQFSRRTGAITVPDLFRERYQSGALGLIASLFILFYMSFMMVAQFKAGAILMKEAWPTRLAISVPWLQRWDIDPEYLVGLLVFTATVVGYTLIGGFLAAVWTDLFQSVMMLIGVLVLLPLALSMAGGLEQATRTAVANTGPGYAYGPGFATDSRQFLPLGLAISFFFSWVFAGIGSPAGMVRIMACRDATTLRRSITILSLYNTCIYLPLVAIFICARAVLPSMANSDAVMPKMAVLATSGFWGGSFLAGLIMAAPFGAVMATVSSYLVVIASGLVRDVYQRFLDPKASDRRLRALSHGVMIVIGGVALASNLWPVQYLQAIVVFSGTGAGATFCVPALMAVFWRRSTTAGTLAAMLAGAGTVLILFTLGCFVIPRFHLEEEFRWLGYDPWMGPATAFRPCFPLGLDPVVWALAASALAGISVSLRTRPPENDLVKALFEDTACSTKPASDPAS